MTQYKITYDRNGCIGAGVCAAVAPDHWIMAQDGKADLVDAKQIADGQFEREIDESELAVNKQAAEGCPAIVIQIFDKDGKKVSP